jgi:hypothetical protein
MAAVQLCPLFPRTALGHHLIQSWVNQIDNAPLNYLSEKLQQVRATQGVLASKFPISILMQIQGQHGCQIFRKIVKNYVPISDFATRLLNLSKPQKSQNFCKKNIFFSLKNANCNQRSTFPVYFLSILNICFIENTFSTKNWS